MENIRELEAYKNMTSYHACEIAEGFGSGEAASEEEIASAWQYIHDTGMWRSLQGFYGRNVFALLESGLIQA